VTTETQALWDLEDAAAAQRRMRDASLNVIEMDQRIADCRKAWHEASRRLAKAEAAITDWTTSPEAIPPLVFMQRLRALYEESESAEAEVRRTKSELNTARAKRGRLWHERKVAIRTKFEHYPLEDWAQRHQAENGHAAEVRVETARVPAEQLTEAMEQSPSPVIEKELEKLLAQESDADPAEQDDDAEPWPSCLDRKDVEAAYIGDSFPEQLKIRQPLRVKGVLWQGRIWVCTQTVGTAHHCIYDVLPLIPLNEFELRYGNEPLKLRPHLPDDATDEDRLQYYTGVKVSVGKQVYAIAPAGEGRRIVRKEES